MQTGIRLQAHPTAKQALAFGQWIGCARVIWNAKCDEYRYFRAYARKYSPIGTYAPADQAYSQFKDKALTPWLYDCPSQILRNSSTNWKQTFDKFLKGICGPPKRKKKTDRGSVHLTRELFEFETCENGNVRLRIGTKKNDLGYLSIKIHKAFGIPNSIRIVKEAGGWYVSFSYETDDAANETGVPDFATPEEQFDWLRAQGREWLEAAINGYDRGVAFNVHSKTQAYSYSKEERRKLKKSEREAKRLQRQMSKQVKGSKRRHKTKARLAVVKAKQRNIRKDFCHKTSRKIVDEQWLINVFENLKLKNMTKRAKPKQDANGKYLPNGAAAKSGLNRVVLDAALGQLLEFVRYKSARAGKILLLVGAYYTSQECASCGHVDGDNRKTQAQFRCTSCGHADNADHNAAVVIARRAVDLILDPGTGLSARGLLSKGSSSDTGRGAEGKTDGAMVAANALGREAPRKKATAALHVEAV